MDIHLIIGPMFSEKSTTLYRKINQFKSIGMKVLVINNKKDTRCDDEIKTHNNSIIKAVKISKLNDIDNSLIKEADVIAIDEAQFFDDIREFIIKYEHLQKKMYICGLDGDSEREKFGNLIDIIPLCNSVMKLNSLCTECKNGGKAPFTFRKSPEKGKILVGDGDKYTSLCRNHYIFMQQER